MRIYRPVLFGIVGATGLLSIYFGILTLAESFNYALFQFSDMWYWILILAAGLGLQLGLHVHIKAALRARQAGATAGVAASGGVSTVAMVACCAHHVTDVLPILGLSAAAVFLVEYQTAFILLGVFSNLVGVTMMLRIMEKHGLQPKTGPFRALFAFDMKQVLAAVVVASVAGTGISFVFAGMSMAELAIRYVLSIKGIRSVVVGVETTEQMQENIALYAKGPLSGEVMSAIDRTVPHFPAWVLHPRLWSTAHNR